MRRLLDADGGVVSVWHEDGSDEHIEYKEDVERQIEFNKAMRSANKDVWKSANGELAAIIPPIFWIKWMNEVGADILKWPKHETSKFLKKKLNDPDYRWLKTQDRKF